MNSNSTKYKSFTLFFFILFCLLTQAQIPVGYYKDAEGKKKTDLKTALHNIIRTHTFLVYDISTSIWWYTYFKATDWNLDGYFWDMYSNNKRATYSGNLMNREHCMPRSWWGDSSSYPSYEANGDLVNLSPADVEANTAKSNLPLGEVGVTSYTNGVVKVGKNTYPGANGDAFEPSNEYKGDFARTYLYMVTCYEDYSNYWHGTGTLTMLNGGTYPVFKTWAINMLLKWNAADPVSQKERNRNDGVYTQQHNRNPFIDHPELAEFIWGKYTTNVWTADWVSPEEEVAFSIKPFPIVSSSMTVKVNQPAQSTYFIKSISGITVKTGNFTAEGTLNIDELQNGMYLLEVYSAIKKRIVTKFIIRH